jgi:uncharacterized membrane protein
MKIAKLRKSTMIRKVDILVNVVLPICLGIFFYIFPVCRLVRNHAPDGLWAYALTSSILIVWNRKINLLWLFIAFISSIVFEILQTYHIVKGVGDKKDILTYLIFGIIALYSNNFINNIYKQKRSHNENKD